MSAYRVGKLFYELGRNPQLMGQFHADAEAVMTQFQLTEEEKTAIRNKDLRFLYQLGVNPYVLIMGAMYLGADPYNFPAAVGNAGPHPDLKTVSFPGPPKEGKYLVRDADVVAAGGSA